jgi:hypothetical protein
MDKQAEIARIKAEYEARNREIERQHRLEMAKIIGGGLLSIGSAFIPGTAGLKVAGALGKTITPMVGKKIGTEIASGLVSGGLSGAVEGLGRGLIENKNPLKTMAQDSAVGLATGGLGGLAVGKIGQNIARKSLPNNPTTQKQYFDDYVEGLSKKGSEKLIDNSLYAKAMADLRAGSMGYNSAKNRESMPNFIGENAFNINKADLNTAKLMKNQGYTPDEIFDKTKWFQGVDEKWRTEIPYGEVNENPDLMKWQDVYVPEITEYSGKVGDIYNAPELYKNYPFIKDMDIYFKDTPENIGGYFDGKSITIDKNILPIKNPEYSQRIKELEATPEFKKYAPFLEDYNEAAEMEFLNTKVGEEWTDLLFDSVENMPQFLQKGDPSKLKEVLTHELQHQIQDYENFARGANANSPHYWSSAGEIEARKVGNRSNYPEDLLEKWKPYESHSIFDIDPAKQVVEFSSQEQFAKDLAENQKIQNAIKKINNNPNKPLQELVYRNGEQVGYGDYFDYNDNAIYIDYLRNITKDTPNYQKGVGSEIMDKILQKNPNKNIIWDAVDNDAEAFKQAYLKNHPEIAQYVFQKGDYDQLVALANDQGYNINDYLELLRGKSKKTGL